MQPVDILTARLFAMQAALSAVARAVLVNQGSDAFIRCEAQAIAFAEGHAKLLEAPGDLEKETVAYVKEIFLVADGTDPHRRIV